MSDERPEARRERQSSTRSPTSPSELKREHRIGSKMLTSSSDNDELVLSQERGLEREEPKEGQGTSGRGQFPLSFLLVSFIQAERRITTYLVGLTHCRGRYRREKRGRRRMEGDVVVGGGQRGREGSSQEKFQGRFLVSLQSDSIQPGDFPFMALRLRGESLLHLLSSRWTRGRKISKEMLISTSLPSSCLVPSLLLIRRPLTHTV